MKWPPLRMAENSLFAILLRSPWWVSLLVAAGLFLLARMLIPAIYAAFFPLPFVVIAVIAASRQWRAPSQAALERAADQARALSWEAFSRQVVEGYRAQGYTVSELGEPGADFRLEKAGRTAVLSCRRWKAARLGVETLQALQAAREKHDVHDGVCLSLGEVTEAALAYAVRHQLRVVGVGVLGKPKAVKRT